MENKKQSTKANEFYFEMQAEMGITKHMGGKKATRELIELCRIDKNKYLLDVGCGVGKTPCYIAKEVGCRVVGVDLYEGMVRRSRERAKRKGIEDKAEFKVGNALLLPFRDNTFDAAISESVIAFVEDKKKAVSEYRRVVKPGGSVGLNECTWIKQPTPKLEEYVSRVMGAEFQTADAWRKLLEDSGLKDIVIRNYKVGALEQAINELKWLDFQDFLGPWHKFLSQFIKNPAYRRFAKETLRSPPMDFLEYVGYGIYVGRK